MDGDHATVEADEKKAEPRQNVSLLRTGTPSRCFYRDANLGEWRGLDFTDAAVDGDFTYWTAQRTPIFYRVRATPRP